MRLMDYLMELEGSGMEILRDHAGRECGAAINLEALASDRKGEIRSGEHFQLVAVLMRTFDANIREWYRAENPMWPSDWSYALRGRYTFDEEAFAFLTTHQVTVDDGYRKPDARYPFYRLRGRPFPPETAKKIIRQTDDFYDYQKKSTIGLPFSETNGAKNAEAGYTRMGRSGQTTTVPVPSASRRCSKSCFRFNTPFHL